MSQAAALVRRFGGRRKGKRPLGTNTPPLGADRTSITQTGGRQWITNIQA